MRRNIPAKVSGNAVGRNSRTMCLLNHIDEAFPEVVDFTTCTLVCASVRSWCLVPSVGGFILRL